MDERRRVATQPEVEAALRDLDDHPDRVAAVEWPAHLSDLGVAGLYCWWADEDGAAALTDGLGVDLEPGRIYGGQTGATRWPSGKVGSRTLAGRVGDNHLRGRIRGSTFRLTLASVLRQPLELVVVGPKKLTSDSETKLSAWIARHLEVAVHRSLNRDALSDLEGKVLRILDPPLNLEGRPSTPLRATVVELRRSLSGAPATTAAASAPVAEQDRLAPSVSTTGDTEPGRVTLHEEIEAILRERGGSWMTTQEIADGVNRRGRYVKRDGSAMEAFQIHGRTKNYPHLFERDGSRVRLKNVSV